MRAGVEEKAERTGFEPAHPFRGETAFKAVAIPFRSPLRAEKLYHNAKLAPKLPSSRSSREEGLGEAGHRIASYKSIPAATVTL
jgi:hypothetical protein